MSAAKNFDWAASSAPLTPPAPRAASADPGPKWTKLRDDAIGPLQAKVDELQISIAAEKATLDQMPAYDREGSRWVVEQLEQDLEVVRARLVRVKALDFKAMATELDQLEHADQVDTTKIEEKLFQAALLRIEAYRMIEATRARQRGSSRRVVDIKAMMKGFEKGDYAGLYARNIEFRVDLEPVRAQLEQYLGIADKPRTERRGGPEERAIGFALDGR